jgi:glutathione S-transferase
MQAQLADRLLPFEEMLTYRPFLLGDRPRFLDFNLFGMLENFLYSGHYKLSANRPQIAKWQRQMAAAKLSQFAT